MTTPTTGRYVEAPTDYDGDLPSVFLAGGITGCPMWQAQAYEQLADLPIAVLNPRRPNFPIHDPSAAPTQIAWEFRHLHLADLVLFWFPDSGPVIQPIALYELGAHAATGKPIVVGADVNYVRRQDVVLQLKHIRPNLIVWSTLEETVEVARRFFDPSKDRKCGDPYDCTCTHGCDIP